MLNQTSLQTATAFATITPSECPAVVASPDFNVGFWLGRTLYHTDPTQDTRLPTPHKVVQFLLGELGDTETAQDAALADLSRMSYVQHIGFAAGWLASLAEAIAERRSEVPYTHIIIH